MSSALHYPEQLKLLDVKPTQDKHVSPDWLKESLKKRRLWWYMQYELIKDKWACYEYYGYFP